MHACGGPPPGSVVGPPLLPPTATGVVAMSLDTQSQHCQRADTLPGVFPSLRIEFATGPGDEGGTELFQLGGEEVIWWHSSFDQER